MLHPACPNCSASSHIYADTDKETIVSHICGLMFRLADNAGSQLVLEAKPNDATPDMEGSGELSDPQETRGY